MTIAVKCNKNKIVENSFFVVFLSAYILIPILLPNEVFRDRGAYIWYARESISIFSHYDSLLSILVNEPLFIYINYFFSWVKSESVPIIFSVVNIIVFMLYLKRKSGNILMFLLGMVLFFTISYTFHYQFVILRQALATSIFIVFLFKIKENKDLIKLASISFFLAFIHSSFLLLH